MTLKPPMILVSINFQIALTLANEAVIENNKNKHNRANQLKHQETVHFIKHHI